MKKSLSPFTLLCFASLIFAFSPRESAADLVINGGFETGAFAPAWTLTDADPMGSLSNVGSNPMFAHSGTFHANLGTLFPPASLSQNLNTTPGGSFTLSFWLAHDVATATPSNSFQVFFNNLPLLTLTNVGTFGYTNFTFPNLVATSGSTPLVFRFSDNNDFFRLDDVSVNVPEPGATALFAFPAFVGLLLLHFRLRTKKISVSE